MIIVLVCIVLTMGLLVIAGSVCCIIGRFRLMSENRRLQSALADAEARQRNAESVADFAIKCEKHLKDQFIKRGFVGCSKCGRITAYKNAYLDHAEDIFLCLRCAVKHPGREIRSCVNTKN